MKKGRLDILEGIASAIRCMKLLREGETFEEAMLLHGEDDEVTEEEVREYLTLRKDEAA